MVNDYITVDALWGVGRVLDFVGKTETEFFLVTDNEEITGVLTPVDLMKSHPNRIVLDAMSGCYKYIEAEKTVWQAQKMLEEGADVLVVTRDGNTAGIITKREIDIEISKHIDLLTGLYNHDYVIYHSVKLLEQGNEIAIIFIDVNNFGEINKQFGHAVGDLILKGIAQILNDNIPEGTYLCRYGGDEFTLVTDKCVESCKTMARELMHKIRQHKFCGNIHIDVSAGIAGGRRRKPREADKYKTVIDLINIASLASTEAKKDKDNLVLGYDGFIDELAM